MIYRKKRVLFFKSFVLLAMCIVLSGCSALVDSNNVSQTNETVGSPDSSGEAFSGENQNQQPKQAGIVETKKYVDYSQESFADSSDKKRVLFFHAKWCPTCIAANNEINENLEKIPAGVVVFKTDYDTQVQLKKKYGITYQHTFVYVDENGVELTKWNGGSIDEIISQTRG